MNFHPPADGHWAMEPRALTVGEQLHFASDRHPWTVRAVSEHFAVLTRPFFDAHVDPSWPKVFYTVLDWRNGYRGPCNLIGQSWGDGSYSEAECAAMLAEFEAGDLEISNRNWVRIRFADEVSA